MAMDRRHQENANVTSLRVQISKRKSNARPFCSHVGSDTYRPLFRRRCQRCARSGNDGLLRSTDAHGNVQNLRYLRGRCHLLRRSDLRRDPHDERSLSRCYSRPLWRAVRCRRAGMGRGLDWLAHRTVHVTVTAMTKRGEPLPINQALNRPRAKLGLDLTAWMAIVFVCVSVFLVGFRFLAMVAFPTLAISAWFRSEE